MCHVHVISNEPLSKEERERKIITIKKDRRNPVIKFLVKGEKKFEKTLERYLKKHPGSILHNTN